MFLQVISLRVYTGLFLFMIFITSALRMCIILNIHLKEITYLDAIGGKRVSLEKPTVILKTLVS